MNKLEELLFIYNCPLRLTPPKVSIEEIEKIIGFTLPDDYKTFLLKYHDFDSLELIQYFEFWNIEDIIDNNGGYQILEHMPNTLGIGTNGGGECIAIEMVSKDVFRVVLTPFINLDKEYHIEIGNSFTDFLERLDKRQKWFD